MYVSAEFEIDPDDIINEMDMDSVIIKHIDEITHLGSDAFKIRLTGYHQEFEPATDLLATANWVTDRLVKFSKNSINFMGL